jgi:eukaryotic-like serine/threonine-protein kinase
LDDRYRLDERIAAGGVGQVWRATDLLLDRPVAVKVLRPEYSDHPETLDRFRKEARHAGALSNPHVAQVYDYGPSGPGGSPFLVMEYVDGPSLADILAVDPIEPVRALDVISQAADGLSAAHRAGLVHRDVKPGNILISKAGVVKVTDFGIAHAAGQAPITGPGLVMGTTQYMAPERIAGGLGTGASDIYALGIVLHECLTGVPPHDGGPAEVMAAHLYLPLPPLPAGIPPELAELVAQLTAKDPAVRIGDALEVADLAAMLRDSLSGGTFVPSARTGAYTGPAAALHTSVPQVAALASEPASALAGGSGPTGLAGPDRLAGPADGGGPAGVNGAGSPGAARGIAQDSVAGSMSAGHTVAMPPPSHPSGANYVSDEWNVPSRMSLPTPSSQSGQPERPRRRPGAIAIGAAAVASAGLIALLVSGVFSNPPAAKQPAGSSTQGTGTGQTPSPTASRASHSSGSAGGTSSPGGSATPGTSSSQSTHPGSKASGSPSGRPGTSSPASPTSSGGPSSSPTGPSSAPTGSPTTAPSSTPSSPAGGSPAPSPQPSSCLLGICL